MEAKDTVVTTAEWMGCILECFHESSIKSKVITAD